MAEIFLFFYFYFSLSRFILILLLIGLMQFIFSSFFIFIYFSLGWNWIYIYNFLNWAIYFNYSLRGNFFFYFLFIKKIAKWKIILRFSRKLFFTFQNFEKTFLFFFGIFNFTFKRWIFFFFVKISSQPYEAKNGVEKIVIFLFLSQRKLLCEPRTRVEGWK